MRKEAIAWYGPVALAGLLLIVGSMAPQLWDVYNGNKFRIEGTGIAKISVQPDSATFDVSAVASLAGSAKEATAKIGDKVDRFAAYLKGLEGVTFSNTPIEIRHEIVEVGKKYAKSFEGKQKVKVTVTNIKLIQSIIDKAVELDINEIGSVRYTLANDEKYRKEARQKALELARANAEEIAKELGVKLDELIDYYESKEHDYGDSDGDFEEIISEMNGEESEPSGQSKAKNLFVSHRVSLYFSQAKGRK